MKLYRTRVTRDPEEDGTSAPVLCGNPLCHSVWHPPKEGHAGYFTRGWGDIAIHVQDRTIYRCQKCYLDRLYETGKTQEQIATAEYARQAENAEKASARSTTAREKAQEYQHKGFEQELNSGRYGRHGRHVDY